MNYYIQGNKDKAEQIKAAFDELGYDTGNLEFTSSQLYYTMEGKVELMCTKSLQNLIKTHPDYKELQLPAKPKFNVGEWLVYKNGNCFAGGLTEAQVVKVKDGVYFFASGTTGSFKFIDECCRLWTIEDAKDGDIIAFNDCTHNDGSYIDWVGIYKEKADAEKSHFFHCVMTSKKVLGISILSWRVFTAYPATKEQRDLLFAKMKEAGYEWDAEKKELRKIKPHYDIKNFYAGMPVLVREYDTCHWQWVLYSHFNGVGLFFAAGKTWRQCIPFEGNERLLGTTDMCDEMYINW